ncbi:hypothetical protein Golob_022845 [Gossypium lobatum]|uniref:Uncharacterized protein n=1 Tax=Gossypium lobatum TaxID=34289 RepID=A0A7J8LHT0_9ROSI|nr:hypothetical protein [Gossypium lobatum]
MASLRIGEEEDEGLWVEGVSEDQRSLSNLCLVGYFVTKSVVHFSAMCNTLPNFWHPLWEGVDGGFFRENPINRPRGRNDNDLSRLGSLKRINLVLGINLEGPTLGDKRRQNGSITAMGQDPMIHDLEDCLIEGIMGRKGRATMKIMSWNIHGLGSLRAIRRL